MTDYKTIKGGTIKVVSSDPSPLYQGQIWYNSTDNVYNVRGASAAWATGGALSQGRNRHTHCGTQTASLVSAGDSPGGSGDESEEYNGVGWTEGNDRASGKSNLAGGNMGTQTAGLSAGGGPPGLADTEEYDGTNWSETANLGTPGYGKAGCGTQTAGLCMGGYGPSTQNSEEYNGTGWTEGNNLSRPAGGAITGAGTQTAGLLFGGGVLVEEYDGTSWSEVTEVSNTRAGAGGFGTQTATLAAGRNESPRDIVEEYNGTSWATGTELILGRGLTNGGSGSTTAGLIAAGDDGTPNHVTTTEEWTDGAATLTITSS